MGRSRFRSLTAGAGLTLAVLAASQSSSDAAAGLMGHTTGLTVNANTDTAYLYQNQPFQCAQPRTSVNVNATHAWMVVTSYSQTAADKQTTLAPQGRAQFAWATFLDSVAYPSSPWFDPSVAGPAPANPALSGMFTTAGSATANAAGILPGDDTYLWEGSCGVDSNYDYAKDNSIINLDWSYVSDITKATSGISGTMETPDFGGATFASAGCDCASYAITGAGNVVDLTVTQPFASTNQYACPTVPSADGTTPYFYTRTGNVFSTAARQPRCPARRA